MSEEDRTAKVKEVDEVKAMERVLKSFLPDNATPAQRRQWPKMSSRERAEAIMECNMKEDKLDEDGPSSAEDDDDQMMDTIGTTAKPNNRKHARSCYMRISLSSLFWSCWNFWKWLRKSRSEVEVYVIIVLDIPSMGGGSYSTAKAKKIVYWLGGANDVGRLVGHLVAIKSDGVDGETPKYDFRLVNSDDLYDAADQTILSDRRRGWTTQC